MTPLRLTCGGNTGKLSPFLQPGRMEGPILTALGRATVRFRKAILGGAAGVVVAAFAIAGGVADKLTSGGFADPGAESERAAQILGHQFGSLDPNVVLLVTAKHGTVDDADVAAAGTALTNELRDQLGNDTAASY